jgi:hypothetical protein
MKKLSILAALVMLSSLAGCATFDNAREPSPDFLKTQTANLLGYPETKIKISGTHANADNTYYLADTPKGRYACSIPSGTMTAITLSGIVTTTPTCNKQ